MTREPTESEIEAAARAIMNRRIAEDFYAIENGRYKYDTDKELARAALLAVAQSRPTAICVICGKPAIGKCEGPPQP